MFSRREFLAAGMCAAASPLLAAGQSPLPSLWLAPETGLLERTGGTDVCQQVERAAELGFRAFCEPNWFASSSDEANRLADTLRHFRLIGGPARATVPSAASRDLQGWERQVRIQLHRLQRWGVVGLRLELGQELQSHLQRNSAVQSSWLTTCRRLADAAARADQTLIMEPHVSTNAENPADIFWLSVLEKEQHPAWKLSCDTFLWGRAGIDLGGLSRSQAAAIGHIELADYPGGGAAGTGKLPLARLLATLQQSGYTGVIALRHSPADDLSATDDTLLQHCRKLLDDVKYQQRTRRGLV